MTGQGEDQERWSVTGLEGLPERRREGLLWRHALTLDYYGVDELVRETSP